MLQVLLVSAVTGETIAVLENEDFAEASVKTLKKRLAQKIGIPRFRLRLFQDNCPMDDDQTLALQVAQRVILEFLQSKIRKSWWYAKEIMPNFLSSI